MNFTISFNSALGKSIELLLASLLIAGVSTQAYADSKTTAEGKIKSEIKSAELKTNDLKTSDASTKASGDGEFKKLDANSDGKISLKEAVKDKTLAAQFDSSDVNHDGMLSEEEYNAYKLTTVSKASDPVSAVTPVTN